MHKIIYYYQTFVSLTFILLQNPLVTHIHLSSIHFGTNPDNSSYIHLNNYSPDNYRFRKVWKDMKKAKELGIKVVLMVGGGGGAYFQLFSNFEENYKLLYNVVKKYDMIDGIDLDIEEGIGLKRTKKIINRISKDFGKDFIISMAPLPYGMIGNGTGMGNFSYKELYSAPEGQRINYFNGQFYGNFDVKTYDQIIQNGFPPDKLVIGMLSGEFNMSNFDNALDVVNKLSNKYPTFGGVFVWEYINSPPAGPLNPGLWSVYMYQAIHNNLVLKVNKSIDTCELEDYIES